MSSPALPQPVPLNRQSTLDNANKFISETEYSECELPIESKEYNVLADIIKQERLQPVLDEMYSIIGGMPTTIFVAGKTKVNDSHDNYYINTFIKFTPFNTMKSFRLRDSLGQEEYNALPIHLSFHSEDPTKGGNRIHIKTDNSVNLSRFFQFAQEIQYKIIHNKEATGIGSDTKIKFVLQSSRGGIHVDFKTAADKLIEIIESILNTNYVDYINTMPNDINSFIRFFILLYITDKWIDKHIRDIMEITSKPEFNFLSSDERSAAIKPISDKVFSKVNSIKGHIKSFAGKIKSDMEWHDLDPMIKNIDIIKRYTDYIREFYSVYIDNLKRQPIYNEFCRPLLSHEGFNILDFITLLQEQQKKINTFETPIANIEQKIKRYKAFQTMVSVTLSPEQIEEAKLNTRELDRLKTESSRENIPRLKEEQSNNINCLIMVVDRVLNSGENPLDRINDLIDLQEQDIINFIKTIIPNIEPKLHYPAKLETMTTLDYYNLLAEYHISNPASSVAASPVAASPRRELSRCVGDADVVSLARTLSNSFTDDKKRVRYSRSSPESHEESVGPIPTNTREGEPAQPKRLRVAEQKYLKYKNKYLQLKKKLLN